MRRELYGLTGQPLPARNGQPDPVAGKPVNEILQRWIGIDCCASLHNCFLRTRVEAINQAAEIMRLQAGAVGDDAGRVTAPVAEAVNNAKSSGPSAVRHIGLRVWGGDGGWVSRRLLVVC